MTQGLAVQKQPAKGTLQMASGRNLKGRFFLSEHAKSHLGGENLLDLLNNTSTDFVPFRLEGDGTTLLVQKRHILCVLLLSDDFLEVLGEAALEEGALGRLELIFPSFRLDGMAFTGDLHPDSRRITDLLNDPRRFFLFQSGNSVRIINKQQVHFVIPQ